MDTEVLGENRLWRAADPVGEQEGGVFREVAVVEDEEKLGAIGAQTLQRVRVAGWKVPQVALLKIIDEATALSIECGDADLAFKDIGPFSFLVPMELADDALIEAHVDTSKLFAGAKLTNSRLTRPATLFNTDVRVCERPAHIWDGTMIGTRRTDQIRVLSLSRPVARA